MKGRQQIKLNKQRNVKITYERRVEGNKRKSKWERTGRK